MKHFSMLTLAFRAFSTITSAGTNPKMQKRKNGRKKEKLRKQFFELFRSVDRKKKFCIERFYWLFSVGGLHRVILLGVKR